MLSVLYWFSPVTLTTTLRGWRVLLSPFYFIYFLFFFWLHRVFVAAHGIFHCRVRAFRCGMGFSLVVECGFSLSSCGLQAQEHLGSVVCGMWALSLRCASSVVVACTLSCPVACGILVLPPGIEPCVPCIVRWILYHWTTREVPQITLILITETIYVQIVKMINR